MAINDLNRIRRVYSFYRPRPVPVTTSADTGGGGGGGPCDCPPVLGDVNYIAEDASVPKDGVVDFVTATPGTGQIQIVDAMRNVHSRRVEHALIYYLPVNTNLTPGTTIEILNTGGQNNDAGSFDAFSVFDHNSSNIEIVPRGSDFVAVFDHASAFMGDNQWRFTITDPGPCNQVINIPTLTGSIVTLSYQPSTVADDGNAFPLIGFDNVVYFTAPPSSSFNVVVDSQGPIPACRLWLINKSQGLMNVDDGNANSDAGIVGNWAMLTNEGRSSGIDHPWFVAAGSQIGPGIITLLDGFHDFIKAQYDQDWTITYGPNTSPAYIPVTAVRNIIEPATSLIPRLWSLDGVRNSGSIYDGAEIIISNTNASNINVQALGLDGGGFGYAYSLATVPGLCAGTFVWSPDLNLWRFEGLMPYSLTVTAPGGGGTNSINYIPENAAVPGTGNVFFVTTTPGANQIQIRDNVRNIHSRRVDTDFSQLIYYLPSDTTLTSGTTIEILNTGGQSKTAGTGPHFYDAFGVIDSNNVNTVNVVPPNANIICTFDHSLLGIGDDQWRYSIVDPTIYDVTLDMTGSVAPTYRLTYEPRQLTTKQKIGLRGFHNIVRVAPTGSYEIVLDANLIPQSAEVTIVNSGPRQIQVAYAALEASDIGTLALVKAGSITEPSWATFVSDNQGTSINGVWRLTQCRNSGSLTGSFVYTPEATYAANYGVTPYFGNVKFVPGTPGNGELRYVDGTRNIHPTRVDLDTLSTQLTYFLPSQSNLTPGTTIELLNASGQANDSTKTHAFDAFVVIDPLNTNTVHVVPPNANLIATYDHSFLGAGDNQWRYSIVDPTIYDTSLEIGGNTVGNVFRLTYEPLLMATTQKIELKGFHNVVRIGTTGSFEIVLDSNLIPQSAEVTIVNSGSHSIPIFYAGLESGDLGQVALLDGATNPLFPSWATFTSDNLGGINGVWRLTQYGSTGSINHSNGGDSNASYVVMSTTSSLSSERVLTAGTGITITDGGAGGPVTIAATGGGSASNWDSFASYVVTGLTSSLANERVLTAGAGIQITDGGANSPVTIINRAPFDNAASYVVLSTTSSLSSERVLTAGTGIQITDGGSNSPVTIANRAPFDPNASYVVLATTSSLANERALTAGTGITITDGGAGSTLTIASTLTTLAGDAQGPLASNIVVGLTGISGDVAMHGNSILWDATTTPEIVIVDKASGVGSPMLIAAQNGPLGGGDLYLAAGAKSDESGGFGFIHISCFGGDVDYAVFASTQATILTNFAVLANTGANAFLVSRPVSSTGLGGGLTQVDCGGNDISFINRVVVGGTSVASVGPTPTANRFIVVGSAGVDGVYFSLGGSRVVSDTTPHRFLEVASGGSTTVTRGSTMGNISQVHIGAMTLIEGGTSGNITIAETVESFRIEGPPNTSGVTHVTGGASNLTQRVLSMRVVAGAALFNGGLWIGNGQIAGDAAGNVLSAFSTGTTSGGHDTGKITMFDGVGITKFTVTGSRSSGAATLSLLTQLATMGMLVDSSSA